jgi:hypothetical protein
MAVVVAVSLAACGGKENKDGKKESNSAAATPAGNTPGIVVVDPNEGKPAVSADTSADSSHTDDSEQTVIEIKDPDAVDTSSSAAEKKKKETKPVFTVKADDKKWETTQDSSSAMSIVYTADDIADAKDNCSIMINSRVVETMAEMTLSEVADAVIDSKGLKDQIEISDRGDTKVGGHAAYTVSGVYSVDGISFDLDISILAEDTNVLEVWVVSYDQCTAAMRDNFNEVLKTIRFSKT